MIPNNQWTNNSLVTSSLLFPHDTPRTEALCARDLGPVALSDASQGLSYKLWELSYASGTFYIRDEVTNVTTTLFSDSGVTWVSLSFDQNGRPFVSYIKNSILHARWFDPNVSGYTISSYSSADRCFCLLDSRDDSLVSSSDVLIVYLVGNSLFWRQQRDRFLVEYNITYSIVEDGIVGNFGFQTNGRVGLLVGTPVESDNIIVTYIKNIVGSLSECQNSMFQLLDERGISTAIGAQLDLIGKIVDMPRNGLSDEAYRTMLYFKAALNNSEGTPNEILSSVKIVTQADSTRLWEHYPACVYVYTDGDNMTSVPEMIKNTTPAGVTGSFILHDSLGQCFTPTEDSIITEIDITQYLPEYTEAPPVYSPSVSPIAGILAELYSPK